MKVKIGSSQFSLLFLHLLFHHQISGQVHKKQNNVVAEMQVICRSDAIVLKVNTNTPFHGMVYAKDAPNGSNCLSEFNSSTNMTFRLPLKSCGTLFTEADDGIEYFNTVVVQPHMRLMTNQGKGYHVRCKYQTRERTIANTHFNVSASFLMQNNPQASTTPLLATASMPSCTMKIYRSGDGDAAETVKIGDNLKMVIEIDRQDMYGMKITNCVVRDGMNIAEQQLIDDTGCPIDENIMPKFKYSNSSTYAEVSFPAHKFPHTSSVYYQCNVRLCINNGGCQQAECSNGSPNNNTPGGPRKKRFAAPSNQSHQGSAVLKHEPIEPQEDPAALPAPSALKSPQVQYGPMGNGTNLSFDVYSGLYVNDLDDGELTAADSNQLSSLRRNNNNNNTDEICISLSQTIFMALMASFATVGVVVMLICQLGCLGNDQQANNGGGGAKTLLAPINYPVRQQRYNHDDNSSRRPRHPYQTDPETMG